MHGPFQRTAAQSHRLIGRLGNWMACSAVKGKTCLLAHQCAQPKRPRVLARAAAGHPWPASLAFKWIPLTIFACTAFTVATAIGPRLWRCPLAQEVDRVI